MLAQLTLILTLAAGVSDPCPAGRLEGRVLGDPGAPSVAELGVRVRLEGITISFSSTDKNGQFRFCGLPVGQLLSVSADSPSSEERFVTLTTGADKQEKLDLRLFSAGMAPRRQVVHATGRPVLLTSRSGSSGTTQPDRSQRASSETTSAASPEASPQEPARVVPPPVWWDDSNRSNRPVLAQSGQPEQAVDSRFSVPGRETPDPQVSTPAQGPDFGLRRPIRAGRGSMFLLQYLNDNPPLRDYAEPIKSGPDDYVTTSIWTRWVLGRRWGSFITDASIAILTNRDAGYRSDLLQASLSVAPEFRGWRLLAGGGVLAMGDFGGDGIQNRYHKLIGIRPVELGYQGKDVSPLVRAGLDTPSWRLLTFRLGAYSELTHVIGSGPSNTRNGAYITCCSFLERRLFGLSFRFDMARVQYYGLTDLTTPMFGKGWSRSVTTSLLRLGTFQGAFRVSHNEYGIDNMPQFGVILKFGGAQLRSVYQK